MANTYNWRINALDVKVHENDLDNVIYIIHWSFIAKDDSFEPVSESSIGTLGVQYTEENPFIPYEDLTKEDVVGWLEEGLDVDSMKENLDRKIELIKNPINKTLHPDWN
jgi:hypothetical protein